MSQRPLPPSILRCGALLSVLALVGAWTASDVVPAPAMVERPARPQAPDDRRGTGFTGLDRFDDVRTLPELQALAQQVREVTQRVRPAVVLLRSQGRRGGLSMGSGVIIGADGLVATCGHVGVRPGRPVTAVLEDGTEISGTTLGQVFERGIDCGLVQLDAQGRTLPFVPLGSSAAMAVGDWVIAMGYTHGLPGDARPALVRVGRVLASEEKELIIDAPIDAGDSGGPSFNLSGEVVGLNSRCGRETWQNVACPIDLLRDRMAELLAQREPEETEPEERDRAGRRRFRDSTAPFPDSAGEGSRAAVERALPLHSVAARATASLVAVRGDGRPVAYGAIVGARGLVVTKASQLEPGAAIEVRTRNGRVHAAEEVARDQERDLALLRFQPADGERLVPVRWAEGGAARTALVPGEVLITPHPEGRNPSLGFGAIERRESVSDALDGPFLGVETRPADDEELERAAADRAIVVVRVVDDSAAEGAGLQPGDILIEVNGEPIGTPASLRSHVLKRQVGDRLEIARAGPAGAEIVEVVLGRRGEAASGMRRGNTATPISGRSSGLGMLLAHDTETDPTQMGGLLLDLDGRVVGLNIARYDRTSTHALDAETMARACRDLLRASREERRTPRPGEAALPSIGREAPGQRAPQRLR